MKNETCTFLPLQIGCVVGSCVVGGCVGGGVEGGIVTNSSTTYEKVKMSIETTSGPFS